jgi:small-conductance mechanosensitive channel
MENYQSRIIETLVVLVISFIILKSIQKIIKRIGAKFSYHKSRILIVKKICSFLLYFIIVGVILFIWGIEPSQLATYVASLLTILGVAFFAQWSLLSNITATLIIFFNHEVHIGDYIKVMDKEYDIEGKINNIGMFFTLVKTSENDYISIPNNVFILKMVKKINQ